MPARGGSAGGFWFGSADRGWQRQGAKELGFSHGIKLLAQGLQRGGQSTGHRNVPSVLVKRSAQLWRSAPFTQSRQPQSGSTQGRLVLSGGKSQPGRLFQPLRIARRAVLACMSTDTR